MASKYSFLFIIVVFATRVSAQSEDELQIPVENDNQFPPENNSEIDGNLIEGSGFGADEDTLIELTTDANVPIIEDIQKSQIEDNLTEISNNDEDSCPSPCVCHVENEDFVVDCSGYDLTEFPNPIDTRTTTLSIQNNKLTGIPKEISSLKQLKILNAANNSIMDLASGSVSELPELKILNLGNNKLVEYPQDLKNSFGLTKLEELDLGGNDMRTDLTPDTFTSFIGLKRLILPSTSTELIEQLCVSLKETLENVCTESCTTQSYECPDSPENVEDDLINVVLPGIIPLLGSSEVSENPEDKQDNLSETTPASTDTSEFSEVAPTPLNEINANLGENPSSSAIKKASELEPQIAIDLIETPKSRESNNEKPFVDVGATTVETKTGGVDKSIIGLIIAGMVVIVAGITIKKNWSSIKNKFSSTPRPANERNNGNANGVSPEEVPLQDKSPV